MGHHNPKHMATDMADMATWQCDDVFLSAQENDFVHMTGKLDFLPRLAKDAGIRPLVIFWGALNLFGGGRSSQFLLEHPECHQVGKDGAWNPAGCYVNPGSVGRIEEMIDRIATAGFEGYFVDEPTPIDCYCEACQAQFREWFDDDLMTAASERVSAFRARCVIQYIEMISHYTKAQHPQVETSCCLMPTDKELWEQAARIDALDNLGTDIYWVNNDKNVEEMTPMVRGLDAVCRAAGKIHHEWFQTWRVEAGREQRIVDQGKILIREKPDAIYAWAYEAQIGTDEASDDPAAAWAKSVEVLKAAKGL